MIAFTFKHDIQIKVNNLYMLLFFVSTEIGQLWLEYGQMMAILGHIYG